MEAHDSRLRCQVDFFMPSPGATSALLFIGLSAGHSLQAFLAAIHPRRPRGRARPRDVILRSFFASNNKLHSLKINFHDSTVENPPATASAAHCLSSLTTPKQTLRFFGPRRRSILSLWFLAMQSFLRRDSILLSHSSTSKLTALQHCSLAEARTG